MLSQVGPTKGSKSGGIFSSVKNSLAVCPGDPPASGHNLIIIMDSVAAK